MDEMQNDQTLELSENVVENPAGVEQQEQVEEQVATAEVEKAADFEQRYSELEKKFQEQGERLNTLLDSVAKLIEAGANLGANYPQTRIEQREKTASEKSLDNIFRED